MTAIIRRATSEDAEAIAHVQIECWRIAYRGLMSDEVLDQEDQGEFTRHWRYCIEETALRFFVATVDDLVVCYCSLDPDGDEDTSAEVGDIPSCYVLPSHWKQGIGRLLADAALAEARAQNLDEVTLTVLEGNQDAHLFFTALGFLPDGTTMTSIGRDGATLLLKRYRKTIS